jgi:Major intrinsic protein
VFTGAKEKGITAGMAVGSVVGLGALFAGPISGASMNPARSLAPGIGRVSISGAVDLSERAGSGRAFRSALLPVRARTGVLWATAGEDMSLPVEQADRKANLSYLFLS